MSSQSPKLTCDALIQLLEECRCRFTDEFRPLSAVDEAKFQRVNNLILDTDESVYYIRKKARSIYITIRDKIGYDVFLLCTVGPSITKFSKSLLGTQYVDDISNWWGGVKHPKGLQKLANLKSGKKQNSTPEDSGRIGMPT
jgi:hypothetical protein